MEFFGDEFDVGKKGWTGSVTEVDLGHCFRGGFGRV